MTSQKFFKSVKNKAVSVTQNALLRGFIWFMLYAIIKRFDSLREITTLLWADTNKLSHLGITFKIGRSTLSNANKRRPERIFENIYRTAAKVNVPNGWTDCRL